MGGFRTVLHHHAGARGLNESRTTVAGTGDLDGRGRPLTAWSQRWARIRRPQACPEDVTQTLDPLVATPLVLRPGRRSFPDLDQAWATLLQRDDAPAMPVGMERMATPAFDRRVRARL